MKLHEAKIHIYADNEAQAAEAAAMLDRFVTDMLQEGRVVTAPKVKEAVANWKSNALVKNRIMNHFPKVKR